VVDIINNDDGSIDRVSINKKAKLNDGEFMSWVSNLHVFSDCIINVNSGA